MFKSNTVQNEKTKWGDREGRRRDILGAARRHVEAHGYVGLNMRDLATQAGVSPGTLYSYFATKAEIFATLYAAAIDGHNERLASVANTAETLDELIAEALRMYVDLYARYGRHFTFWSVLTTSTDGADAKPELPDELVANLRAATLRHASLLRSGIKRVTAARGDQLVDDGPLAITWLWMSFVGFADHYTTERRALGPDLDPMLVFTARAIAQGLVVRR